ncbi:HRDC domain-containing protein [Paenibacillus sp. P96]|uniref:HRDC domain-containing protein n=1 Tax=Paenibacillus zeirhizosphaerae TaxID=2987519 RepID=A0ABT9FLA2_9BACL|nr:HRDC domain-containing protein [Paenibacillus sp. P96]MDP4095511.1 HRDC domain-containing protein [Paenibacillus sp. P96]
MEIVFLNKLSKSEKSDELGSAQVWIGEEEGIWCVGWRTAAVDSVWYEGCSWQEMLSIYRYQLALKLAEGYRPLIEGVFHEPVESGGRSLFVQKLFCYSDLHPRDSVYSELSVWRRRQAAAENRAPYMIASNRLLKLISVFLPRNEADLLELPGVGETKVRTYGADLLAITSQVEQYRPFPLSWVEEELDAQDFISWSYRQKEQKYKLELDKYHQRQAVLQGSAEGLGLEAISRQSGLPRREVIEMLEVLVSEGYDVDNVIQSELSGAPEQEQTAIRAAYRELGDRFLKPVMQRVYGDQNSETLKLDEIYERLRLVRICYRRDEGDKRSAS